MKAANKRLIIFLFVFLTIALPHSAIPDIYENWESEKFEDELTGRSYFTARSRTGETVYVGLQCSRLSDVTSDLKFIFKAPKVIAAPNSDVVIYIKIDDFEAIAGTHGQMFENSYEAAYIRIGGKITHNLLDQMKRGNRMKYRVRAGAASYESELSLAGFTQASENTLSECEYSRGKRYPTY